MVAIREVRQRAKKLAGVEPELRAVCLDRIQQKISQCMYQEIYWRLQELSDKRQSSLRSVQRDIIARAQAKQQRKGVWAGLVQLTKNSLWVFGRLLRV